MSKKRKKGRAGDLECKIQQGFEMWISFIKFKIENTIFENGMLKEEIKKEVIYRPKALDKKSILRGR